MSFNPVSMNNIGAVISLFLVILLSQAMVFNFLLDTPLGRAILILFILVISYTNKILGVVSVLFIIIMFNNSDIGYLEGFTSNDDSTNTATTTTATTATNPSPSNVTPSKNKPTTKPAVTNNKPDVSATPPVSINSTSGSEGFNTIDNERNIQKGKQSNSISVNSSTRESMSNNVEPFDGGSPFDSSLGNMGLYGGSPFDSSLGNMGLY